MTLSATLSFQPYRLGRSISLLERSRSLLKALFSNFFMWTKTAVSPQRLPVKPDAETWEPPSASNFWIVVYQRFLLMCWTCVTSSEFCAF